MLKFLREEPAISIARNFALCYNVSTVVVWSLSRQISHITQHRDSEIGATRFLVSGPDLDRKGPSKEEPQRIGGNPLRGP